MGYYTHFELTWEAQKGYEPVPNCQHKPTTPFCSECGTARGFVELGDAVARFIQHNQETYYGIEPDGEGRDAVKWYDWQNDMVEMSKQFPTVLFKLHGEGEENGDIWDAYFLNGKSQVQKAKVMIDACDPKAWK